MQRFKNILLVLDDADFSSPAAQRAVQLAETNNAALTVVDVLRHTPILSTSSSVNLDRIKNVMINERYREIEQYIAATSPDLNVKIRVLSGKDFIVIIRYVLKNKCDLVIKAVAQESRLSSMFFGSLDLRLLRKCPCPVWLIKSEKRQKNNKILAAVQLEHIDDEGQLDALNRKIMQISSSLAYTDEAELHIVNAWVVFEGGRLAKKLSKQYRDDVEHWVAEQRTSMHEAQQHFQEEFEQHLRREGLEKLKYTFHFLEGIAEEVIVTLADKLAVDLIVMGTLARTDLAGLLIGNTSEAILNQIDSSVIAIKPAGFISPVALKTGT
ncbi:MAG: universal stress protein [Desulfocapsaceae bacterium]|nr:universal stress protein [Desulfocapsaceae bacterium]